MSLSRFAPVALIVVVLLSGAWIFIRGQEDRAKTSEVTTAERLFDSVVFNPADVIKGDRYGAFTVTDIFYVPPSAPVPNNYYRADFSGTATLVGTIGNLEGMCDATIENISPTTAKHLPRATLSTEIPTEMFLDISQLPEAQRRSYMDTFATMQTGDEVEVTIGGFRASNAPKECSGNRGFVTSFKKI